MKVSKAMNTHWTAHSTDDFVFRIAADFIVQLEDKMESLQLSQDALADILGVTKGRVSQIFNNPGNLTLKKIVEYCKALNMKVAITSYEDNDPENRKGPINSEIFKICWERSGKPRDFWALEETNVKDQIDENHARAMNAKASNIYFRNFTAQMPPKEVYRPMLATVAK